MMTPIEELLVYAMAALAERERHRRINRASRPCLAEGNA